MGEDYADRKTGPKKNQKWLPLAEGCLVELVFDGVGSCSTYNFNMAY